VSARKHKAQEGAGGGGGAQSPRLGRVGYACMRECVSVCACARTCVLHACAGCENYDCARG